MVPDRSITGKLITGSTYWPYAVNVTLTFIDPDDELDSESSLAHSKLGGSVMAASPLTYQPRLFGGEAGSM